MFDDRVKLNFLKWSSQHKPLQHCNQPKHTIFYFSGSLKLPGKTLACQYSSFTSMALVLRVSSLMDIRDKH